MSDELLTHGQEQFAGEFAKETGMDPRVVGAWLKAEQSGSAAKYYENKGYYDWLNIANTDSGPASGAHSSVWSNPITAAKASAEWMKGTGKLSQEYGQASPGIRGILKSAGRNPDEQISAIAGSGWASSGYNHGNTLRELYGELSGHNLALISQVQREAGAKADVAPVIPEHQQESNPIDAITAVHTGAVQPGTTSATIAKNWEGLKSLFEPSAINSSPTGQAPALALPGEQLGDTRTLDWATQHLGKFAESEGQNLGPELNKLEKQFGMTGEPWCAIFATTAVAQGGASRAVRTASVAEINEWATQGSHGYTKGLKPSADARKGDLITFGDQHVALVKEVKGDTIVTIEGNANGSGGVVELTHKVGEGQIARPRYGG